MPIKTDLTNKRFGRLIVIREVEKRGRHSYWLCLCDCGQKVTIRFSHLKSGNTSSCGCLQKELAIRTATIHGMSHSIEYQTWYNMMLRCNDPNYIGYKNYGERGIVVCKRWSRFENFFKDMGKKPKGLTLERKNNELGYFKDNCCWDTQTAQRRNQRLSVRNKTGICGVSLKKSGKYHVEIGLNYKTYKIGCYSTLEQASIARKQAEKTYWK